MKMYMLNPFVRWSDQLNKWKFPDCFKFFEPKDWENMNNNGKYKNARFRALIAICNFLSTSRQRLNYHHVVNLHRTQDQFNFWWENERPAWSVK